MNTLARSNASLYGTKDDLYDRLKRHAYTGKKGKFYLDNFMVELILIYFSITEKSDSDSEGQ